MKYNEFFGSKLNTVLLFILIILMIIAIRIMLQNKELYFQPFSQNQEQKIDTTIFPISGNKDDFVSFSIFPGQKVSGIMKVTGFVKNGYFFEGNIVVNILDMNRQLLKGGYGTATSEWMTTEPVSFETTLDFSSTLKGFAYIEIHNDNPSGLPANDKSIFIPVVIE